MPLHASAVTEYAADLTMGSKKILAVLTILGGSLLSCLGAYRAVRPPRNEPLVEFSPSNFMSWSIGAKAAGVLRIRNNGYRTIRCVGIGLGCGGSSRLRFDCDLPGLAIEPGETTSVSCTVSFPDECAFSFDVHVFLVRYKHDLGLDDPTNRKVYRRGDRKLTDSERPRKQATSRRAATFTFKIPAAHNRRGVAGRAGDWLLRRPETFPIRDPTSAGDLSTGHCCPSGTGWRNDVRCRHRRSAASAA